VAAVGVSDKAAASALSPFSPALERLTSLLAGTAAPGQHKIGFHSCTVRRGEAPVVIFAGKRSQNQLRPSTRAVEGFVGVGVAIRACGEVGFRSGAEVEIGRGRFADGPSAVLAIEFQHAVGGGCAVRDLGFRFFAHGSAVIIWSPACAFAVM
jgi:hypothetical protein